MAQLTFEKIVNLTTYAQNSEPRYVEKLQVGNDPNNDIYQYYSHRKHLNDKKSHIDHANYDVTWSTPETSVTAKLVRSFGVKNFPTIGSIGFYTPIVGNSKILVPIHVKPEYRKEVPGFALERSGDVLQYTITQPEKITYECFRIILSNGTEELEHVTYDLTGEIAVPSSAGTYTVYCIGYVTEGSNTSEPSESYEIVVTAAQQPAPVGYYSKAEVDAMISRLEGLINTTE